MIIQINHLAFSYGKKAVLRDISFQAKYGELICLLGKNGAGKSTLFRCLLGMLRPGGGSIRVDGKDPALIPCRDLARLMAYVPQRHSAPFRSTVLEMVLLGTNCHLDGLSNPGCQIKKNNLNSKEYP